MSRERVNVIAEHRFQTPMDEADGQGWLGRRGERRLRRVVATALCAALVASLDSGPAVAKPERGEWQPPTPPEVAGVAVQDLPAGARPQLGLDAVRYQPPAEPVWPAPMSARVALPADSARQAGSARADGAPESSRPGRVQAGDSPVRIGAAPAASTSDAAAAAGGGGAEPARPSAGVPEAVRVRVLDRAAAGDRGVDGVLLTLARDDSRNEAATVTLEIDYSGFAHAYGGEWASRLRLIALPECTAREVALAGACPAQIPLPSTNDVKAGVVAATVSLAGDGGATMVALSAEPSGPNGTYTATTLSPAGTWQVSAQTGGFSWQVPLRMPPAVGGPAPSLALSYSSQAVDGRTGNTNSQGSWIGDGWDLWSGFVERRYQQCSADLDPVGGLAPNNPYPTGDSCWFSDNATLSLNGRATELVRAADGTWKGVGDDGSRIERLTDIGLGNGDGDGEYWKVTTTDGMQYFFGRHHRPAYPADTAATDSTWVRPVYGNHPGEPCYQAGSFSGSRCEQAWRWNLDYVLDPHGNTMTYFYEREVGAYAREANPALRTTYHRGGYLSHIEYGTRTGTEHSATVPARVVFEVADRCLPGEPCDPQTPASWPDTPWDQWCAAAPCTDQLVPTFWTGKRLAAIRTQVWRGSGFADVDSWTLRHDYLDAGAADGEGVPMWLSGLTHTGHVTTAGGVQVSEPEIVFDPGTVPLANRVDGPSDGRTWINRYRMKTIRTESGGLITVDYSEPECTLANPPQPHTNTMRCFPQWYGPNGQELTLDWFHKYIVDAVYVDDATGGSPRMETHYAYLDTPAWHYDDSELVDEERRTWSQWRGYTRVQVRQGDPAGTQSVTEYLYMRGMHGDRATPTGGTKSVQVTDSQGVAIDDHEAHAGFLRESTVINGGAVVTGTISDPWRHGPTATSGPLEAWLTNTATSRNRTALVGGGWRWTRSTTSFDTTYGLPTQVDDLGDEATAVDDRCIRYDYARNTTTGMVGKVSRTHTFGVDCATTPQLPADVLADERVYFDDPDTHGAAPTRGLPVKIEQVGSWTGTSPNWVTTSTASYDIHGRPVETFDELGRRTGMGYTPTAGGPVLAMSVTNALDHTTTTHVEPAWGLPSRSVDPNNRTTEISYDGLGRLTQAWTPGRDKATQTPNVAVEYLLRTDAPSAVTTRTLLPLGTSYHTSITLLDGSLRTRQVQAQAPGGGRTITDTHYDSRGLVDWTSKEFYDSGNNPPSTTLVGAGLPQIPGILDYLYDGAGRVTDEIFLRQGVEAWRTSTGYGGDRVHVTPPAGGTAVTTISDARGQSTELRQHHGPTPTGTYDLTRYTYTDRGELATVIDAAGNIWTWTYDQRGRAVEVTDPDRGTTTRTYDDAGQLRTSTDERGVTLGYTHDDLGRKTSIRDGSQTGPLRAEWVYDTLPGGLGALTRAIRHDDGQQYITEVLGYDAAGRPTGSRIVIPAAETGLAGTYDTTVHYLPNGALAGRHLPALGGLPLEHLVYAYNDIGLPTEITSPQSIYVYSVAYNKLREPTQRVLGNVGSRTVITYLIDEPTGRLANTSATPEGKPEVMDLAYSYDPAGNLTRIADSPAATLPVETQCLRYDHLRRLTTAWTPLLKSATNCVPNPGALGGPAKYWHDYTYDAVGNRQTLVDHTTAGIVTTTYSYPDPGTAQPHTLDQSIRVGPGGSVLNTYQYDQTGNTTQRVIAGISQSLDWDAEGHLEQITESAGDTSYLYDADGNRLIRRDADGGKTLYLPGQELHHDGGAQSATRYYTHLGTPIAVRTPAGITWTVTDHHNTGEIMIRESDMQVQRRRTLPFGQTRGTAPAWWAGDKGFLGGTDDPSRLTHLGARLYDPSTGRFISVDPIMDLTDPQQMHGYAYANGNPATFADPSGLLLCGDDGCNQRAIPKSGGGYIVSGKPKSSIPPCAPFCDELKRVPGGWPGAPGTPNPMPGVDAGTHVNTPCETVYLTGVCLSATSPQLRQGNIDNGSTAFALDTMVSIFGGTQSQCMLGKAQIICVGIDVTFQGRPMTFGDVLFYPGSIDEFYQELRDDAERRRDISDECNVRGKCLDGEYYGPNLLAHEANHSDQWAEASSIPAFVGDYAGAAVNSYVWCEDAGECNFYEVGANPYQGGYLPPPELVNGEFEVSGVVVPDASLVFRN
jgi:RHS repeat-associated protein